MKWHLRWAFRWRWHDWAREQPWHSGPFGTTDGASPAPILLRRVITQHRFVGIPCSLRHGQETSVRGGKFQRNTTGREIKRETSGQRCTARDSDGWSRWRLLFYSAVNPFLMFATKLMISKYGVDATLRVSSQPSRPSGTILLTPVFGTIYDKKGKGVTLIIIGACMLTAVHICFHFPSHRALMPFSWWSSWASPFLWCRARYGVGSQDCPNQKIRFRLFDYFLHSEYRPHIGPPSSSASSTVDDASYTTSMLIFASFGIASIIIAVLLLFTDRKYGYGLQNANDKDWTFI